MSAAAYHVPDGCPDIVTLATSLWGQPTETKRDEVRFGSNGSKSVKPHPANVWTDFETNESGGYVTLYEKQFGQKPERPKAKPKRKITATYDYRDEGGSMLFQVCRLEAEGEPKTFKQRRPDAEANDGWRWSVKGTRQVPYNLPDILAAPPDAIVYVVEGEKDVNNLQRLGLVASCNAGGAMKWRNEISQHFADRHVVILPDNDTIGGEHADEVAGKLFDVAASVRIVQLPTPDAIKGDVSDWLAAGGTAEALAALVEVTEPLPISPAGFNPRARDREAKVERDRPRQAGQDTDTPPAWQQFYQMDDKGNAIGNLANALTALRSAAETRDLLAFDEMTRTAIIRRTPPGGRHGLIGKPRPVMDADVSAIQEWLQRQELRRLGKDTTHQAVDLVAMEHAYHPVRNYLNTLTWDGSPRLHSWLTYYLGCEPAEGLSEADADSERLYVSAIGKAFLIAMVARIMNPGCKADYLLILEGEQGALKSTVCGVLAGEWFSDGLPDIRTSDAVRLSMHLRGKWLIEIAELSAMSKGAVEDVKKFVTQRKEIYTPKFGRKEVVEDRQCLFVGTTNQSRYLKDETGARRFWPVKVGTIDVDALRNDRDQLFAEAVVAYRRGDQWWPDRDFEAKHIAPQQEARFEQDSWEPAIAEWLAQERKTRTTINEVAWGALHLEVARLGTIEQRRISAVLTKIGWKGKKSNGSLVWKPGAPS
jgi:predicted P-loop ATPase